MYTGFARAMLSIVDLARDYLSYVVLVSGDPSYVASKPSHPMLIMAMRRNQPSKYGCAINWQSGRRLITPLKQSNGCPCSSRPDSSQRHIIILHLRNVGIRKGKNIRPLQCSFHAKVLKRYRVKILIIHSQAEKLDLPKLPGLVLVFLGFTPLLESNPNIVV